MVSVKSLFWLLLLGLLTGGCFTAELVQGPNGSWYETGRQVAYPDVEVLRGKKKPDFPLGLQVQIIEYYQKQGFCLLQLLHLQRVLT